MGLGKAQGFSMYGLIFDIKEFALNDGGGIRSTVFFKGCPLRCVWCHNPEGLSPKRELYIKQKGCLHCGLCRKPCNHPDCQGLGRCLHICPKNLVSVAGVEWESGALAEKLLRQTDIYRETGGGVTLSGGEPLLQWQFAAELLDRLHRKVHTETFGQVQEELARRSSKMEGKKVGDKTLQRKYSGKYAMSDLLICGECGSAYRRCIWTAKGEKRIVWRCMNRLEHGKQNCKHSPTLGEDSLQAAVMDAITERVKNDPELLQTLQAEIEKSLSVNTPTQAKDITNRIAEIDHKFAVIVFGY